MQVKTIAFYHYTFPAGGAEVVTCNLGRFFAKHGFRVLLYTWKPNAELLTEELRKIFDIRPLPDTKRISGVRNTDFLCESLKTERADVLFIQATTDIAFEQIRTRTTAKIIFCLHNTPFWEVYDLKHKKSSEIPRPTLTRRLEYALLRKPAYRLTRKLEQRYAQ
ncbi:glycosyltransferase family 4 protein, partial [Alistipes shahii]